MQSIKLRSHIGVDSVLHIDIPSEFKEIDVEVTVTI